MNRKIRLGMVAITFLMVLALSAIWTVPALADDATPQPPDVPAVSQGTSDAPAAQDAPAAAVPAQKDAPAKAPVVETQPKDPAPTEAPAVQNQPTDPASTEAPAVATQPKDPAPSEAPAVATEAPAVATQPTDPAPTEAPTAATQPTDPAPTEAPVSASPTAAPAPTEAAAAKTGTEAPASPADLSQVPTGTNVKVLDATGAVVPLASTEAAQIVATGDPVWCPATVASPAVGGNSCSPSSTSFQAVIDWLTTNHPGTAGVIWISKSYKSSDLSSDPGVTSFTLNGASIGGTTANYALTIRGGWIDGTGIIDTAHPSTFDGASLSILNWNADVTLSDIIFTGILDPSNPALTVTTKTTTPTITKNITLTRVDVHGNAGAGANLDNSSGPGNVTVSSSNFSSNAGGKGLGISSKGAITLNSVTANGNGTSGASLDNHNAATSLAVTLTGTNTFNANGTVAAGDGLDVYSKGSITLNNLSAIGNTHGYGALLNNTYSTSATPQVVTLTGTIALNQFNTNYYDGLNVVSYGLVTLNNVTASGNGTVASGTSQGYGVFVNNRGNLTLMPDVIVNGTNTFNTNWLSGMEIHTNGAITVNGVTATNNGQSHSTVGDGLNLDNCNFLVSACVNATAKNITLNGTNNLSTNYQNGLSVKSKGAITLNNVTAGGNGAYGASLDNHNAATPFAVTLAGTNAFSANYSDGLNVLSKGSIVLNNLTATGNTHGYGALLNNTYSTSATPQVVTLTGTQQFNTNYSDGLNVLSYGVVTLNNVTASGNGTIASGTTQGYGVFVNNRGNLTLMPDVIVNGTNGFNTNWLSGMEVHTNGAITINSVTATGNGVSHSSVGDGLNLDNCNFNVSVCVNATAKNITLNGTNILSGNFQNGLSVKSKGAITLNNVTASGNGAYGASLDNKNAATPLAVTLAGTNALSGNVSDGLNVLSKGGIVLNNLTASGNTHGYGARLNNTYSTSAAPQVVTLTGTIPLNQFNTNYSDGLNVVSYGVVTLNNVMANGNGTIALGTTQGYGVFVDNRGNLTLMPDVIVNGTNTFNTNWLSGMEIHTNGAITVNSATATNNGQSGVIGDGLNLDNCNGTATTCANTTAKAVTLNGTNNLSNNHQNGLFVKSKGAITVNGLTANSNTGYGAQLNNKFSLINQVVTVNGGSFNSNSSGSLNIQSNGTIKLNSLPMWCPVGATPGALTCSKSYTNLQALILDVGPSASQLHPNLPGVIWIQNSTFESGGAILFDSTTSLTWSNWANNSLTLQGGWSGPGATISTVTTLKDPLSILNWKAEVTLNDIAITGLTDGSGTALTITTTKNITLNRVNVHDNAGAGADLDNTGSTANVTVTSSTFSNNARVFANHLIPPYFKENPPYTGGLVVHSKGTITLSNLVANGNGEAGVLLYNEYGTVAAVSLNGIQTSNNGYTGLVVQSFGTITANSLTATSNTAGAGAYLYNKDTSLSLKYVTVTGTNTLNSNGLTGLVVYSKGAITITNVTANLNTGDGAGLDNSAGTVQTVTLTGTNIFNSNNGNGLTVTTKSAINYSNLTANGNGLNGANLKNTYAPALTPMGVTISNSTFNSNAAQNKPGTIQMGLLVYSNGTITLTNINANYNGSANGDPADGGVYLDNTAGIAGISMTGTNFISNNATGLKIKTNGAVLLYNLVNNGNSAGFGAFIDNCTSVLGSKCTASNVAPVSILGISEFKFNAGGLHITTNGLITLNKITATYNQGTSCEGTVECGGAYLFNANSSVGAGITLTALTGTNNFSNNVLTGLQVYSTGIVTLNNVNASNNGWYDSGTDTYHGNGAYIDNTLATTPKAVSLLGTNSFNNNATGGLVVYSKGAITANNLSASYNGWTVLADSDPTNSLRGNSDGAHLDNCIFGGGHCATAPLTAFVTLTGVNTFNSNAWGTGLNAQTPGVISVSNLTANNNGNGLGTDNLGSGVTLKNDQDPWLSAITVSGYGNASSNGNWGISVSSTGAITMSKLAANSNGGKGVIISNAANPGIARNVSLTDTSNTFNSNGDTGLNILSYGLVTLNNLTANSNGHYEVDQYFGHGVYVDNSGSTLAIPPAVSITGVNTFNNNNRSGLEVTSKGAISTTNLTALNNGYSVSDSLVDNVYGYGVKLDNTAGLAPVNVTGTNYFDSNWNSGLDVRSRGAIIVYNLTSNSNGRKGSISNGSLSLGLNNANGAYLNNQQAGAAGDITIFGYGSTRANYESGLEIHSVGNVSLINLAANYNNFRGVYIFNAAAITNPTKNVTISGTNTFNYNTNNVGLEIDSYGTITLNNINASSNGGAYNAYIDNCRLNGGTSCNATVQSPVTLTGNNSFDSNSNGSGGEGLFLQSFGSITISNLSASNNSGQGATLKNQWQNQLLIPVQSAGVITLSGYANFNGNGSQGLDAWSNGIIAITNLNANTNHDKGVVLHNDVSPAAPRNITISGTNTFSSNSDIGLSIHSYGTITLNNISANSNGGLYNADIDNCRDYLGIVCTAITQSPVTLTGNNSFDGNSNGTGLNLQSFGSITINNLSASNNRGMGATLNNQWQNQATTQSAGTLTITGYANFNGNHFLGLAAWSNGNITIANLNANTDGGSSVNGKLVGGAYLDANKPGALVSNVVLTGVNNFNQNSVGKGLVIFADGTITISNLTASQNQDQDGAYLDNQTYGSATSPQAITLTGNNTFLSNFVDGLNVSSYGAIAINNLTANNNGGDGAYLDNQWGLIQSNITLTGPSFFDGNTGKGLGIDTNGLVSLSNIDASKNSLGGAVINADGLTTAANVTIGGSNFFQNNQGGDGLRIISDGVITLNNITANLNSGNGAYLDNSAYGFAAALPAIRLNFTGTNVFNGNGSNGLQFNTYGNASMSTVTAMVGTVLTVISTPNITADTNGADGVLGTVTNGNMILACGSMNSNGGHGYNLSAVTTGKTITLSGVNGYSNTIPGNVATALTPIIRNIACPYP